MKRTALALSILLLSGRAAAVVVVPGTDGNDGYSGEARLDADTQKLFCSQAAAGPKVQLPNQTSAVEWPACSTVTLSFSDFCASSPQAGAIPCEDSNGFVPIGVIPDLSATYVKQTQKVCGHAFGGGDITCTAADVGALTGSGTANYYPLWATGGASLTLGTLYESGPLLMRDQAGQNTLSMRSFSTSSTLSSGFQTTKSHASTIGTVGSTVDGEQLAYWSVFGASGGALPAAGQLLWLQDGAADTNAPGRLQLKLRAPSGTLFTSVDCRSDKSCAFAGTVTAPTVTPTKLVPASGGTHTGYAYVDTDGTGNLGEAAVLAQPSGVCASGYALTSLVAGQTSCIPLTTLPANATGWLHNNGSGPDGWTTPTAAQVGAAPAIVLPNISIPDTPGNSVTFAQISNNSRPYRLSVYVTNYSGSKIYEVANAYPIVGNNTWYSLNPISDSGAYDGNSWYVDIYRTTTGNTSYLRARRSAYSSESGTLATVIVEGSSDLTAVTSNALCSSGTPCTDVPSQSFFGTPAYVFGVGTATGTTSYLTKKTSSGWGDSRVCDDGVNPVTIPNVTVNGLGTSTTFPLTNLSDMPGAYAQLQAQPDNVLSAFGLVFHSAVGGITRNAIVSRRYGGTWQAALDFYAHPSGTASVDQIQLVESMTAEGVNMYVPLVLNGSTSGSMTFKAPAAASNCAVGQVPYFTATDGTLGCLTPATAANITSAINSAISGTATKMPVFAGTSGASNAIVDGPCSVSGTTFICNGGVQATGTASANGYNLCQSNGGNCPTASTLGGANQQLSNLSSVAFNTDLLPDGNGTRSLGSNTKYMSTVWTNTLQCSSVAYETQAYWGSSAQAHADSSGNISTSGTMAAGGTNGFKVGTLTDVGWTGVAAIGNTSQAMTKARATLYSDATNTYLNAGQASSSGSISFMGSGVQWGYIDSAGFHGNFSGSVTGHASSDALLGRDVGQDSASAVGIPAGDTLADSTPVVFYTTHVVTGSANYRISAKVDLYNAGSGSMNCDLQIYINSTLNDSSTVSLSIGYMATQTSFAPAVTLSSSDTIYLRVKSNVSGQYCKAVGGSGKLLIERTTF